MRRMRIDFTDKVKASPEYKKQITEMLDEWYAYGEKIIPYAIRRLDYHDFEHYYRNLEVTDTRVCKGLGTNNVLMVCDKDNVGSAKSILNNGGVLENEVVVDGVIEQRYWITLD